MAILHVIDTWFSYLIGRYFQIKVDHHSLNYLLEQWLSSLEQHKWITKMLVYDYEIIYTKGKENVVVDALSRKYEEISLFVSSLPIPDWIAIAHQE
jgi:hypothetical protein